MVDPEKLRALLDVLSDKGVSRAKLPVAGGVLEVDFAPLELVGPAQPGDEDLPWNARDPDDAIRRANLERGKGA